MITVGLTGSIASGKSLLASLLEKRGAAVIDADRIGHDVLAPDGPAHAGVVAAFGPEILGPDGAIDRERLGSLVFRDEAARRRLEAVVRRPILAELGRRLGAAADAGARVAVVDAALICEWGLVGAFDVLVVVMSTERNQLDRLAARGIPREEGLLRIGAQWPAADKARWAHILVANDGSMEDLARESDRVWQEIARLTDRPARLAGFTPGKDRKP